MKLEQANYTYPTDMDISYLLLDLNNIRYNSKKSLERCVKNLLL
jgi:hypothetical protein